MSNRDKVFTTIELLETILSKLPPRDLLLSQRVSQLWRNTIHSSLTLKRALFLEPKSTAGNALKLFPKGFESIHWTTHEDDDVSRRVIGNPFLSAIFPPVDRPEWWITGTYYATILYENLGTSASWEKMYITSPPISVLECEISRQNDRHRSEYFYINVHAENDIGVTFGDVFKVFQTVEWMIQKGNMVAMAGIELHEEVRGIGRRNC